MFIHRRLIRPLHAGLVLLMVTLLCIGCSDTLDKAREAEGQGDIETALLLYKQHLEEEPEDLEALKELAVLLYISGDFDAALPYQEEVVALDLADAQMRVELGFNYLNHQEQPQKAVHVLLEAAELERTPKHLAFLSQAQAVAGDPRGAEASLREALSLDDQYAYTYVLLTRLLDDLGRAQEADEVRAAAEAAGVTLEE